MLLISAFLFACFTCAAMSSSPAPSAHTCCPKSGQPSPDRCAKSGCISTVPVLRPESVPIVTEFAAVPLISDAAPGKFRPEWAADSEFRPIEYELFLRHRQFLI